MNCKESITKPRGFPVIITDSVKENINTIQDWGTAFNGELYRSHAKYLQVFNDKTDLDAGDFYSIFQSIGVTFDILIDKWNRHINKSTCLLETWPERKWKEYRLEDCIKVCAQETDRIVRCLECNPSEDSLRTKPIMELEQQFGIWEPYASDDDTDDEDWQKETGPFAQESADEDEYESESDGDIVIVE